MYCKLVSSVCNYYTLSTPLCAYAEPILASPKLLQLVAETKADRQQAPHSTEKLPLTSPATILNPFAAHLRRPLALSRPRIAPHSRSALKAPPPSSNFMTREDHPVAMLTGAAEEEQKSNASVPGGNGGSKRTREQRQAETDAHIDSIRRRLEDCSVRYAAYWYLR